MNNKNFPNGLIYKIELEDNIRLDKWTWKTNEGYISSIKDNNYLVVNENNPEATEGFVPQNLEHGKNELHGSTIETVYVRFLTEGMKYGEFTAYDKAGNSVKIKIAANIDRTAPPIPENLNAYVYDKVGESGKKVSNINYSFQTWTNRFVRVETIPNQNRDDLINNTTLAGFWKVLL